MKNKYQILSIHIQVHVKKTNYNTTHDTEILLRGNWFSNAYNKMLEYTETNQRSFISFIQKCYVIIFVLFVSLYHLCVIERGDQSEACWVTNNTGSILLLQYSKDLILHITPISYSYFSVPAHHIQAKRTFWTLHCIRKSTFSARPST